MHFDIIGYTIINYHVFDRTTFDKLNQIEIDFNDEDSFEENLLNVFHRISNKIRLISNKQPKILTRKMFQIDLFSCISSIISEVNGQNENVA